MTHPLEFEIDVLVIGGGPAGTRAALSASHAGARVMLVDKGDHGPVSQVGAHALAHSPALELLTDAAGTVRGAAGIRLRQGKDWTVRAGAVVLATGGWTRWHGVPGSDAATGDGQLMAAEVGATPAGLSPSGKTGIDGLWAAGATTSLGAITSGSHAGRAAAEYSLSDVPRNRGAGRPRPAGRVGLRPSGPPLPTGAWREFTAAAQNLIDATAHGAVHDAKIVAASVAGLSGVWMAASAGLGGGGDVHDRLRARETASMIANALLALAPTDELKRDLDRHVPAEVEDALGDLVIPFDVEVTPIDHRSEIDPEAIGDLAAGIPDFQWAVHLAGT